jgi:integrase
MSRLNKITKTDFPSVFSVKMDNGNINYIVRFSYKGTRYSDKNFTSIYQCKSAQSASNQLVIVKDLIDKGKNPFKQTMDTVDKLAYAYIKKKAPAQAKILKYSYDKWSHNVIGHLVISNVTIDHIDKIKNKMFDDNKSPSTVKKQRDLLSAIFERAFLMGKIERNIIKLVEDMGYNVGKPKLTQRLNEPLLGVISKIYKKALEYDLEFRAFILISIMNARRAGEIYLLEWDDIEDNRVNVRAETTKTFKKAHVGTSVESYPLSKETREALEYLKLTSTSNTIFTHPYRHYQDAYRNMVESIDNIKYKKLATTYPIRSHENRNFIISICSEKFGETLVGSATLSHSDRSNMNSLYNNTPYEFVEKVFKYYWKKLRKDKFKTLTKKAIKEQVKELAKEEKQY